VAGARYLNASARRTTSRGNFTFLAQHIPQYFGTVRVEDVISTEGESIKNGFLLDCCYGTELLTGTENNVTDAVVLEQYPHVSEAGRRMENYRIRTLDASGFNAAAPKNFKIIDFEMEF
jgi:hypothetical protein